MKNSRHQGNLAEIPFSFLLFSIWKTAGTGRLSIQNEQTGWKLAFFEGDPAAAIESFNEDLLLSRLKKEKILDEKDLLRIKYYARENQASFIKSITEMGLLTPYELWQDLAAFFCSQIYTIFDLPVAEYYFEPEPAPREDNFLFQIPTLDLILDGTRRMQNQNIFAAFIPAEEKSLIFRSPDHLNRLNLHPHEKYILKLVKKQNTVSGSESVTQAQRDIIIKGSGQFSPAKQDFFERGACSCQR